MCFAYQTRSMRLAPCEERGNAIHVLPLSLPSLFLFPTLPAVVRMTVTRIVLSVVFTPRHHGIIAVLRCTLHHHGIMPCSDVHVQRCRCARFVTSPSPLPLLRLARAPWCPCTKLQWLRHSRFCCVAATSYSIVAVSCLGTASLLCLVRAPVSCADMVLVHQAPIVVAPPRHTPSSTCASSCQPHSPTSGLLRRRRRAPVVVRWGFIAGYSSFAGSCLFVVRQVVCCVVRPSCGIVAAAY